MSATAMDPSAMAANNALITTGVGTDGASNSTSTGGNSAPSAWLDVCMLSAYDLPQRTPPQGVQISIADGSGGSGINSSSMDTPSNIPSQQCGPPVQRHKDRNSFRFDPHAVVRVTAPSLAALYHRTVVLTLLYPDNTGTSSSSTTGLQATFPLHQLRIDHTKWLVLNLQPAGRRNFSQQDDKDDEEEDDRPVMDHESTSTGAFTVPPTIRLKLTLHGPYRTEIATAVRWGQAWCNLVDQCELSIASLVQQLPDAHWFLIPLVPLAALAVAATPIVAGVMVVAFPMVVPLLVLIAVGTTLGALAILVLYASTQHGRQEWVQPVFGPLLSTWLATETGQQCMYQTGPRPTPVQLCRFLVPHEESIVAQLLLSLWLDLMGSSSYILPFVGELADLVWAPIQTTLLMAMYPEGPSFLKYLSMTEELLPFTDIVPSATIGWLSEHGLPWVLGTEKTASDNIPPLHMVTTTTTTGASTTVTPSTPFSTPRM